MRRVGQSVVEDLLLNVLGKAIRVLSPRAALLLGQRRGAADVEGALHLVERVAVVAHDLAALGDVAQFFSELEQRELSSGTLCLGGDSVFLLG